MKYWAVLGFLPWAIAYEQAGLRNRRHVMTSSQIYPDPYTRFGISAVSPAVFDAGSKVAAALAVLVASHVLRAHVFRRADHAKTQ